MESGRNFRRTRRLRRAAAAGILLLGVSLGGDVRGHWPSRQLPATTVGQTNPVVSSVCLHPTGQLIAAAGDDHLVRLWSVREFKLVRQWSAHTDWVRSIAFSPTGTELATSGNDGRVLLWDITTGTFLRTLAEHERPVAMLRYSPDGRLMATIGFADKLRVYEVATAAMLLELDCPCRDMRSMGFSPDGRFLAAGGRNGKIKIWDLTTGQAVRQLEAHEQRIRALEFSPDGVYLISAGEDRVVRVWNMLDGQVFDLPPLPAKVLSLVFCGSERVALGMSDNSIRFWDLPGRKELALLEGHAGSVSSLDYRGGMLVSGSFDTTIRVWDLSEAVAGKPSGGLGAR